MLELRREAVYGTGQVRHLARFMLEGMAEKGEDPTGPVILKRGPPYPEWTCGSAAFSLLGWPYSRVHASYHEQLRRVMAEYEQLGKQLSDLSYDEQDEWYEKVVDATVEHLRAAEILGIHRRTLYRKLEKYKIPTGDMDKSEYGDD